MVVLPLILGLDRLPYLRVHNADRMLAAEHRFWSCWSLRSLILMASGVELAFAARASHELPPPDVSGRSALPQSAASLLP
jgi:hypothetical protein